MAAEKTNAVGKIQRYCMDMALRFGGEVYQGIRPATQAPNGSWPPKRAEEDYIKMPLRTFLDAVQSAYLAGHEDGTVNEEMAINIKAKINELFTNLDELRDMAKD